MFMDKGSDRQARRLVEVEADAGLAAAFFGPMTPFPPGGIVAPVPASSYLSRPRDLIFLKEKAKPAIHSAV